MRFFVLLFITTSILHAQTINKTRLDAKGNAILLGKTNKQAFENSSFKWFEKNYADYITNNNIIKNLKKPLQNYTIKAFYGSWCGDSKREVPRFYKVIEKAGFKLENLDAIAVDKKPEAYKASPEGEEKGLNIHRVPTFIFYKDGKEINRIVESPIEDFERDIYNIINQQRYTPNYQVVSFLDKMLHEKGIDSLRLKETKLVANLADFTQGSKELNTYGYKLLRSNQIEKALYIFSLNTKIYPYKSSVFDSLGEAFFENKNYTEALKNYYKVLAMEPQNKNALTMIDKIKTIIK